MKSQGTTKNCYFRTSYKRNKKVFLAILLSLVLVFQNVTPILAAITSISLTTSSDGTSTTVTASVYTDNFGELMDGSTNVSYSVLKDGIPATGLELPAVAKGSVQTVSEGVYRRDYQFTVTEGLPDTYKAGTYSAVVEALSDQSSASDQVTLFNNNRSLEFIDIAGGVTHSLALKDDGTVWEWGDKNYGQSGNVSETICSTPKIVEGLSDVISISAGSYHSLVLKKDGTVWAWGYNYYGLLGNVNTTYSETPIQVVGLNNVVSISAGEKHNLALKKDGTVWAWGSNWLGQLGTGGTIDSSTPLQTRIDNVTEISACGDLSIALKTDGTVWTWGSNYFGELGIGYARLGDFKSIPVQVAGLEDVRHIDSAGFYAVALKKDGTVWAWGFNYNGVIGQGYESQSIPDPTKVDGLSDISSLASGSQFVLALRNDGRMYAWGTNYDGRFGNGTTTKSFTPTLIENVSNVVRVAVGGNHSLMIKNDGTVWACGGNSYGQVGNGTTSNALIPVKLNFAVSPTQTPSPSTIPSIEPTPSPSTIPSIEPTPSPSFTPDMTPFATLTPTPFPSPTPLREIKGIISLGLGYISSDQNVYMTASNDNFTVNSIVELKSGQKSTEYSIKVPAGSGYKVSYYIYFNSDSYLSRGYYSDSATTYDASKATPVDVTDENAEDINLILIGKRTISGTVSLPDGEVAPQEGIPLVVEVSNTVGRLYMFVPIQGGSNSTTYTINVPTNIGAGYKVSCYNLESSDYLSACGYSICGTVPMQEFTSMVDVSSTNKSGIDITLIKSRKIRGTVALPAGIAPDGGVNVTVQAENDNYSTSRQVLIPQGQTSVNYEIDVPVSIIPTLKVNALSHNSNYSYLDTDDFLNASDTTYVPMGNKTPSSSYKVSYSLQEDSGYLPGGLYSVEGTTYSDASASSIDVRDGDVENINMTLISGTKTISGIISLPAGEVAPEGGLNVRVFAVSQSLKEAPDTFITIPEESQTAVYTISVPALSDFKIEYALDDDTNTKYVPYGFYSTSGIKDNIRYATPVNTLTGSKDGINLTLLRGVSVSGTISIPYGYKNLEKDLSVVVSISNDKYRVNSLVTIESGSSTGSYEMFVPEGADYIIGYDILSSTERNAYFGYYYNSSTTVSYSEDAAKINVGSTPVTGINFSIKDAYYVVAGNISLPDGSGSNTYSIMVPYSSYQYYIYYLLSPDQNIDEYHMAGFYSSSGMQSDANLITGVYVYTGRRDIDLTILAKTNTPPPASPPPSNPPQGGGEIIMPPVVIPAYSTTAGQNSKIGADELKNIVVGGDINDTTVKKIDNAVQKIINANPTNETEAVEVSKNIADAVSNLLFAILKTSEPAYENRIANNAVQLIESISNNISKAQTEENTVLLITLTAEVINNSGTIMKDASNKEIKTQIMQKTGTAIGEAEEALDKIKNNDEMVSAVNELVESTTVIANQRLINNLNKQKQLLVEKLNSFFKKATDKVGKEEVTLQINSGIAKTIINNTQANSIISKAELILKLNYCVDKYLDSSLNSFKGEKKIIIDALQNNTFSEIQIDMPSNILRKLKEKGLTSLDINSDIASVSIPSGAVETKEIHMITLSIKNVENSELSAEVINKLGDAFIYDFNLEISKSSGVKEKVSSFNSELEVRIPYILKSGEDSEKLVVYYLEDSGKLINANAKYDPERKMICFKTNHFSKYAVKYNDITFGDIGNFGWAQKAIEVMASKGVVSGRGEGKFDPGANITRAEFATIIVKALGLYDEQAKNDFSDVKESDWYCTYIASAVKAGIFSGYPDETFKPNDNITRQDMAVVLGGIMKEYKGIEVEKGLEGNVSFEDSSSISEYAGEGIALSVKYNVLAGMPGNKFAPKQSANRAQAAVVIYKLFNIEKNSLKNNY